MTSKRVKHVRRCVCITPNNHWFISSKTFNTASDCTTNGVFHKMLQINVSRVLHAFFMICFQMRLLCSSGLFSICFMLRSKFHVVCLLPFCHFPFLISEKLLFTVFLLLNFRNFPCPFLCFFFFCHGFDVFHVFHFRDYHSVFHCSFFHFFAPPPRFDFFFVFFVWPLSRYPPSLRPPSIEFPPQRRIQFANKCLNIFFSHFRSPVFHLVHFSFFFIFSFSFCACLM